MTSLRRYACHRVYDAPGHYLAPSVVTVDEEGRVVSYALLTEETAATEWIGGVIVLSSCPDLSLDADFSSLWAAQPSADPSSLYAWHINPFDFAREAGTSQSRLRRL